MTEQRFFNYWTGGTARSFKAANAAISRKTVLTGGALDVIVPDQVTIDPISMIFDSGIILFQDTQTQRTVPLTSAAKNYTLTYRHTDSNNAGGNAAVLALESGFILNSDIPDGLAIGYIAYPGGSVVLTQAMLIPAPQMHLEGVSTPGDVDSRLPPFGEGFMHGTPTPEAVYTTDGSVTDNGTTFTTVAHNFISDDVGKSLKITNSSPNSGLMVITARLSSTQVTVNRTFAATESALDWELIGDITTIAATSDTALFSSLVYANGIGGITFSAVAAGPGGDDITIQFQGVGPSQTLSVALGEPTEIIVTLGTDAGNIITSTVTAIANICNATPAVSALVSAVVNGSGSQLAGLFVTTALAGGASGFGFVYSLTNPTAASESDVLKWTFVARTGGPKSIVVEFAEATGSSLTLAVTDTDGTVVSFPSGTITNVVESTGLVMRRYRITNGFFQPGKRFHVQATVLTAAGTTSSIASIGSSSYQLPF